MSASAATSTDGAPTARKRGKVVASAVVPAAADAAPAKKPKAPQVKKLDRVGSLESAFQILHLRLVQVEEAVKEMTDDDDQLQEEIEEEAQPASAPCSTSNAQ